MGIPGGIQDTHRDVSLPAYLRESLPSFGWAWASSFLGYQKAQPISRRSKRRSRETMTSPALGITGDEAWCIRKRDDLQGKDEGLSWATHPTTIIPGQRQGLALQFSPQTLSWEATLSNGWSICGSRVVRWRIDTHLWHQIWPTVQGKCPLSQAALDIKTHPHRQTR